MPKYRFKALLIGLLAVLLSVVTPVQAAVQYDFPETADQPLRASSAMLIYLGATRAQDVVLFERQADTQYMPGALLRVAVGAYAARCIEEQQLNIDEVTGTYTRSLFNHYVTGTGLGTASMALNETWTLRDLLSVSMIQTAADATVTMAVALSGSVEAFVQGMNELAAELGCHNSHFTNVTGLDDINQYMSARDVWIFTRYAAENNTIRQMMSQSYVKVKPVSGGAERGWENTNSLLRSATEFYDARVQYGRAGTGGEQNLQHLVAAASSAGYEYMTVVMGTPRTDASGKTGLYFVDAKRLLDWGFDAFTYKTLLAKGEVVGRIPVELGADRDSVELIASASVATIVANDVETSVITRKVTLSAEQLTAPVEKGTVVGKVTLLLNLDEVLGEVDLIAAHTVERSDLAAFWKNLTAFFASPVFWICLGGVILLIALYVLLNIVHNRRRRRRRMKQVRFRR